MTDIEIWKDIEGYEGYYQVSNMGRVKSVERTVPNGYGPNGSMRTIKEKILKQGKTTHGYCFVVLCVNHAKKNFFTHRLVAKAFLTNPHNYTEINHKSENKEENFVENLEWCDRKYNCNYGSRNRRSHKNRRRPIIQSDFDGLEIMGWFSCADCEQETGYDRSLISKCCQGKVHTAYGFKWHYAS